MSSRLRDLALFWIVALTIPTSSRTAIAIDITRIDPEIIHHLLDSSHHSPLILVASHAQIIEGVAETEEDISGLTRMQYISNPIHKPVHAGTLRSSMCSGG